MTRSFCWNYIIECVRVSDVEEPNARHAGVTRPEGRLLDSITYARWAEMFRSVSGDSGETKN